MDRETNKRKNTFEKASRKASGETNRTIGEIYSRRNSRRNKRQAVIPRPRKRKSGPAELPEELSTAQESQVR